MKTKLEKLVETLEPGWKSRLQDLVTTPPLLTLAEFLADEKALGKLIYPPDPLWLAALQATPFDAVKVVIVGQDPYHGPGQAMGLSFSVPTGVRLPPSLRNIYQELSSDCGIERVANGNLSAWTREGVLLLNSVLTVEAGLAGSHQNKGWEIFTDTIVKSLSDDLRPKVFILWGSYAQAKGHRINTQRHCVLKAVHPSPLSAHRGFFGCRPFSKANQFLEQTGQRPIDWSVKTEEEIHA